MGASRNYEYVIVDIFLSLTYAVYATLWSFLILTRGPLPLLTATWRGVSEIFSQRKIKNNLRKKFNLGIKIFYVNLTKNCRKIWSFSINLRKIWKFLNFYFLKHLPFFRALTKSIPMPTTMPISSTTKQPKGLSLQWPNCTIAGEGTGDNPEQCFVFYDSEKKSRDELDCCWTADNRSELSLSLKHVVTVHQNGTM